MNYVYVINKEERFVSMITISDKTCISLCEYNDLELDYGIALTWNEYDSRDFLEYCSIEDIIGTINFEKNIVFSSEFTIAQMYSQVANNEYSNWNKKWDSCIKVLQYGYSKGNNVTKQELLSLMQK